jgi:hypothetical protein
VVTATLAAQSQPPWFGTWNLDISKSTPASEARYKRGTAKIEPWGDGLRVTYDLIGVRGGVTHLEWTGRFDGKDYAVQGLDYVLTHAYSLLNDRSYRIVIKTDSILTATATVEVSPDGKTLTTVTQGKTAQGNTVETKTVYEKDRAL